MINIASAAGVQDQTPTVSMSKSEYIIGETAQTSYTNSTNENAWIGIYTRGQTPGSGITSLLWQYTKNISQPNGTSDFSNFQGNKKFLDLTVGSYTAFLFLDDGYTVLSQVDFEITASSQFFEPKAVSYVRSATQQGYADGTITVTPPDVTLGISEYWVYWGNDSGRIQGYTPFVRIAAKGANSVSKAIVSKTTIPAGATKIVAYSVSGSNLSDRYAQVSIAQNIALSQETPLYSFEATSDWHITDNSHHDHNNHLDLALKDIKKNDPDSLGIMSIGDVTNGGKQAEYDQLKAIIEANKTGLPPLFYMAID
jgi:hypothetical protein